MNEGRNSKQPNFCIERGCEHQQALCVQTTERMRGQDELRYPGPRHGWIDNYGFTES